jgi:hypothetical protein
MASRPDDEVPSFGDDIELAPNTFRPHLDSYLHALTARRFHLGQPVDILAFHMHNVIATGNIIEIISAEMFADETGQFHDAIIAVRLTESRQVRHYSPNRVIPISDDLEGDFTVNPPSGLDREVAIPMSPLGVWRCDDC